jgi:uncharacterized membrane protein
MPLSLARRSLVAAELVWTASVVAAAYVESLAHAGSIAHGLAAIVYACGSVICHQRPERSFFLRGAQLPVCARCAGIYAGAALACLAPIRHRLARPGVLVAAASAPVLASLVYEWSTGVMPANAIRAATGIALGAAVMAVLRGELRGD